MILHTKNLHTKIFRDGANIRKKVFVEEQQRPLRVEFTYDEAKCIHLVYYIDQRPAGTLRLYPLSAHIAKIQRVAILPEFRGQKLGSKIIAAGENLAREYGYLAVVLDAQEHAIPFYDKLNYVPTGEETFILPKTTILHLPMIKQLEPLEQLA
ncbi:GNAT family N-acetyltransferase [Vagococcus humatus]|nr:GNAT family N-acetyltransferase [Vagococcus humatus]